MLGVACRPQAVTASVAAGISGVDALNVTCVLGGADGTRQTIGQTVEKCATPNSMCFPDKCASLCREPLGEPRMLCSLVPYKGGIPFPKVRVFPDCPLRYRILLAQVGRGSLATATVPCFDASRRAQFNLCLSGTIAEYLPLATSIPNPPLSTSDWI